jgi:hypothetical protein
MFSENQSVRESDFKLNRGSITFNTKPNSTQMQESYKTVQAYES